MDGPVSLVAKPHAREAGGPLLQDAPFLHVDGVYFRAGLQGRVKVHFTMLEAPKGGPRSQTFWNHLPSPVPGLYHEPMKNEYEINTALKTHQTAV